MTKLAYDYSSADCSALQYPRHERRFRYSRYRISLRSELQRLRPRPGGIVNVLAQRRFVIRHGAMSRFFGRLDRKFHFAVQTKKRERAKPVLTSTRLNVTEQLGIKRQRFELSLRPLILFSNCWFLYSKV